MASQQKLSTKSAHRSTSSARLGPSRPPAAGLAHLVCMTNTTHPESGLGPVLTLSQLAAQLGVMLEHPYLCRALVGDLGRATRLPDLAVALRTAFYEPIEQLMADGVRDGSLRQVADPGIVAASVFGAITVTGLGVAVEGPSTDPRRDAVRLSESICMFIFDGLAMPRPGIPPGDAANGTT